jgi:hypothetical protein
MTLSVELCQMSVVGTAPRLVRALIGGCLQLSRGMGLPSQLKSRSPLN